MIRKIVLFLIFISIILIEISFLSWIIIEKLISTNMQFIVIFIAMLIFDHLVFSNIPEEKEKLKIIVETWPEAN